MAASIVLTGLSSSNPVPGTYLQIAFAQGSISGFQGQRPILLVGNKTSVGIATNDTVVYGPTTTVPCQTESDVINLFGPGSELHRMWRRVVQWNTQTSIYLIAVTSSTGAKSTMTFQFNCPGTVTSVNVTAGSMTVAPTTVTFSAPISGTTATGTVVTAGSGPYTLTSVTITNAGSGYTYAPTATLSGNSGGTPATATPVITLGTPTTAGTASIWVADTQYQYGYNALDTLASITAGLVLAINGNTTTPVLATQTTIENTNDSVLCTSKEPGTRGNWLRGQANVINSVAGVSNMTVDNTGGGIVSSVSNTAGSMTVAPTSVTFSAPPSGTTATGTVTTAGSGPYTLTSITITNAGSGYVTPPTITLVGNSGGTAATATAQITFGTNADAFFTGGTVNDSNTTALSTIKSSRYYYIVSAAEDTTQVTAFGTQITAQALPVTGIRSRLFVGSVDTSGNITTLANTINNARVEFIWSQANQWTPSELAANAAGLYALYELVGPVTKPKINWSGFGNGPTDTWNVPQSRNPTLTPSYSTILGLLGNGVTPIGWNGTTSTYLVKRIVSYSLNGSNPDYRIRDAGKVTICDFFGDDLMAITSANWQGRTFGTDPVVGGQYPDNTTITPNIYRLSVIGLIRQYAQAQMLVSTETVTIPGLIVQQNPQNLDRMDVGIQLLTVSPADQFAILISQIQ